MSRSKHKAQKLMDGESREDQEAIARFGLAFAQDRLACRLIERWEQIFVLFGDQIKYPKLTTEIERTLREGIKSAGQMRLAAWASHPKLAAQEIARQTGLLLGLFQRAVKKGYGTFLRHMADSI